jgi:hypothetical protein
VMRKRLLVLLMAVMMAVMMVAMSAAPAFASHGFTPHRPQPNTPPGLTNSGVDRPDNAATSTTGRSNADHRNPCFVGLC